MYPKGNQDDRPLNPREAFNQGIGLATIHTTPIEMFFRKIGSKGVRSFGMETFYAFIYMPVFGAVVAGSTGEGLPVFLAFWLIYVLLLAMHRGASEKAALNESDHTRYIGDSIFTSSTALKDELKTKKNTEPVMALIIGLCSIPFSIPLAAYFIIGAFLLPMPIWISERREKVKRMDWQDAWLENQRFSQWVREQQERNTEGR